MRRQRCAALHGLELISDRIPDETTILTFRHLLEKHDLGEQIFEAVKSHLSKCGMTMRQGTIVDAILIAVPARPKTKRRSVIQRCTRPSKETSGTSDEVPHRRRQEFKPDPFRVVTSANVHDLTPAADLLHGDEQVVYGDPGYQVITKRPKIEHTKAEFRVAMRPGKCRALSDTQEGTLQDLIETAKAHIRSKVEHPFRVIKQQFDFQNTRLRGLSKNRCKINVLAALTNLLCTRRQIMTAE